MADFVAVLRKTLDGLGDTTPEVRARVYDKARATIAAKLSAISPPPPAAVAERQKRALEDAISSIERDFTQPKPATDPLAELENIFSSIDRNKNQATHARPAPAAARTQPSWQPPQQEARPTPAKPQMSPEPSWKPAAAPVGTSVARAPVARQPAMEHRPEDFADDDEPTFDTFHEAGMFEERRRGYGGLIAAVIALLVIAGGGYGVWLNQDAFKEMLGLNKTEVASTPVKPAEPAEPAAAPAAKAPTAQPAAPAADGADETPKFTQRLTPEGKEVDPGPAAGENQIGEGTSIVALNTPPTTPAAAAAAAATGTTASPPADKAPASASGPTSADAASTPPAAAAGQPAPSAPATGDTNPAAAASDAPPPVAATDGTPAAPAATSAGQPALAVGQKAIFYEERTNSADGSAEPGSIVWSLVQESPGGDAPPEPAIRAEATIPGKNVQLRLTIRRNADQTLPASHIIEMIFLTPDGFEGGGIDNVLRIAMKTSEQEAGSPLIGIPAKIADGFFLVALNDTKADEDANLTLLRNQDWIDIPVVYKSGRRALLTMEKGLPGEKVFDEALKAWQAKTTSPAASSGG